MEATEIEQSRKMGKIARFITRIIDALYLPVIHWAMPLQTFRYAVCGAMNVVMGWVLYFVTYNYVIDKSYINLGYVVVSPHIATLVIVFPFTFLTGYFLNKYIAFKHSVLKNRVQFIRYFLSVMGSFGLNYGLMKLLVETFHVWATPSQMAITLIIMVYSYLMQKYFSFWGSDQS